MGADEQTQWFLFVAPVQVRAYRRGIVDSIVMIKTVELVLIVMRDLAESRTEVTKHAQIRGPFADVVFGRRMVYHRAMTVRHQSGQDARPARSARRRRGEGVAERRARFREPQHVRRAAVLGAIRLG